LIALREELVQGHAADHVPKARLGILRDRVPIILHGDHRGLRIADHEKEHAIDHHRHVVPGNDLLVGDLQRQQPGIDESHRVHDRKNEQHARAFEAVVFSQAEDHRSFPLRGNSRNPMGPDGDDE